MAVPGGQPASGTNGFHTNGSTATPAGRLQNRVALVTGASSGLGRAISLLFAEHGAKLVICADIKPVASKSLNDESTPTHEEICRLYGEDKARFVSCNVCVGEEVKAAVSSAVQWGGRLDIIVNNAGVGSTDKDLKLHQLEEADWDRIMNVNARGVFLGSKYACAQMVQQPPANTAGTRGWVINVSSIFGMVGYEGGLGAYCASKGAVVNMTRQMACDYAKDRIQCNTLCPGFLKTAQSLPNYQDPETFAKMTAATPWGDWCSPQDQAKGALYLAGDDAPFVTGVALNVDGGFLAR